VKSIILAGGFGTRISEETDTKPKPMVLLDSNPIIWHLMHSLSMQGLNDFYIATGYKGEIISDWVSNQSNCDWQMRAVDTGLNSMTGGRIKRCMQLMKKEVVFATYGDGLGNIKIKDLLAFHKRQGKIATVTAVRPPARFGVLESSNGLVTHFGEKNQTDSGWINGGFFIFEPQLIDYIAGDESILESEVLPALVADRQLAAYHHEGFWQPMDTLREKNILSELAACANPPWLQS